MGLRQFAAGGENHGRAAALKAIAYTTGDAMRDERNNRSYDYASQADRERVLLAGLFLPSDVPEAFMRANFASSVEQQQFVWSHLAAHEEAIHRRHKGANQHTKAEQRKPIISRHDVLLLDKRIFLDAEGKLRPGGLDHARQVVRDFLRENYTRKGLVVSFAIHDQENGNGNFHVHIVSSYRTLTAAGWDERKRPFGKSEWAVWAKEKQNSALKIQTRKLEALGVIPKVERVSSKRETLTAWKMARGLATKPDFQPSPKARSMNFKSAPVRMSRAISVSREPASLAFVSTLPARSIAFAAPSVAIRVRDENQIQLNPDNAGSGYSDGGGGAGGDDGVDFELARLQGGVACAEERLKGAIQSRIGIAAAQAALATAKRLLAEHRSSRGKGKAKGSAFRPSFNRHQHHHPRPR